jgi:hypothetical protein
MIELTVADLEAIRTRASLQKLPLFEVSKRCAEEYYFFLEARQPTADETAAVLNRSGVKTFVVFGKLYPSVRAACRTHGINITTVYKRSKSKAITLIEAFEEIIVHGVQTQNRSDFLYDGVVYPSLTAACRAHGINDTSVHTRSKSKGITLAEAFEEIIVHGVQTQNRSDFLYDGVVYPSLTAACRAHGIDSRTVHNRSKRKGTTLAEAFEAIIVHGVQTKNRGDILYDGVVYASLAAACRAHGIDSRTVHTRSKRKGITLAEAFEEIIVHGVQTQNRSDFLYDGVTYSSLTAACRAHGINLTSVHSRSRSKGITITEAFEEIVVHGVQTKNRGDFLYNGVVYPCLRAACRAHGVNSVSVHTHSKRKGVTLTEAFEYYITKRAIEVKAAE